MLSSRREARSYWTGWVTKQAALGLAAWEEAGVMAASVEAEVRAAPAATPMDRLPNPQTWEVLARAWDLMLGGRGAALCRSMSLGLSRSMGASPRMEQRASEPTALALVAA